MLDSLTKEISEHAEFILASACGERQGWIPAMRSYGLEPGQSSGEVPAPEAEVREALWVVVRRATAHLDQVCVANPDLDPVKVEAIRSRLARLVDHEAGRYGTAIAETSTAPPAGVASIFQNAVQTSKMSPWANLEYDRKVTVVCKTCGAAQQSQAEFRCEFCGSDVFER